MGLLLGAMTASVVCGVAACSASNNGTSEYGSVGTGGADGGGVGGFGAGTSDGGGGSGGGYFDGGTGVGGSSGSGGTGQGCAGVVSEAKLVPLDMYIMFDKSGSMSSTVTGGQTKMDAIRAAVSNFVQSPDSAGMGVGIQFFPLNKPGVPDTCTTSNQCGTSGPCLNTLCDLDSQIAGQIVPCASTNDCTMGGNCVPFGTCSGNPTLACINLGQSCGSAADGNCVALTNATCMNGDSCDASQYGTPAVAISVLPNAAGAITGALAGKQPNGNTPSAPALQGAIDYARSWAVSNPTHTVIVVLSTDGVPTECTPLDIGSVAQIAQDGANGAGNKPKIQTFVIGIFSSDPSDAQAAGNLQQIASAGGTGQPAFIVNTSQNVTQQFLDALNKIRGSALACEYSIPAPPQGQTADYNKINVQFDSNGQQATVYYVGSADKCDPQSGGWYYDVDPSQGQPTKIIACPTTCNQFKTATTGSQVSIQVGCDTQGPK